MKRLFQGSSEETRAPSSNSESLQREEYIPSSVSVMEGEVSEGNPSAPPSHSLPPSAEAVNPADGADLITTPGSSEETATHTQTMGQPRPDHGGPAASAPTLHDQREEEDPAITTTALQREDTHSASSIAKGHHRGEDSSCTSATFGRDDQNEADPPTPATPDNLPTQPGATNHQAHLRQPRPQENPLSTKLCGYLHKLGGPLKAWKLRWFTYEEKKSQLFYYRTAQDVTPLGRAELRSATFGYPLKGEDGTFHIQTPERTFVLKLRSFKADVETLRRFYLKFVQSVVTFAIQCWGGSLSIQNRNMLDKAANREAMMYWLQQLQLKRWQHRNQLTPGPSRSCTDPQRPERQGTTNNWPDNFLPRVKMPTGLVGEEAASRPAPSQGAPLSNMSIKHPLIEIQNSVHSLRSKRSSQEMSQSVFHLEAPPWNPPEPTDTLSPTGQDPLVPNAPVYPPTPTTPLQLVAPAGRHSPAEHRASSSLLPSPSPKSRGKKRVSSATLPSSADRMSLLQQENHMLAEEVKAQKELVWLLHKTLEASQLEKRTCTEFLAADGEQERLELLRHRERLAADLRGRLEGLKAEGEGLRRSLAQRDAHVAELQENIILMMEKNHATQEVILKLSNQTACMADPRRAAPSSNGPEGQSLCQLQEESENLKDDIEAYKTQNKFLNSEIYQLTKLWRNSSEQEKNLFVKCAYLEASNCQMESRYLGVLRKLQENKGLEPGEREAVRKLIEDALQGDLQGALQLNPFREHDEYGFKIAPDYELEDMKLLAKIQALEIRSHNLLRQEVEDRPLLSRWAQYLARRPSDDLGASPELKSMLRAGVPREYRARVWRWVVRARTLSIRERHPGRYSQLCTKNRTSTNPASRQIQLDLHRTLTTNQHFSSPSSPTLQQLERILLAFSWQNPTIGYCQGLNRLAAIALLVLQSEEDAFWCLVAVVEAIMPQDYYTKTLIGSQADQRVLKDFMAEKMPRLTAHFEEHNVDVSLITFNWFLVVFVESLPSDILLRVWDAFLYEGTKVIFRYSLAIFKYKEEDILKIHDSVEIYQYLRFFTKTISDVRKLTNIAFTDMNPFPRRLLRNRRAFHLDRLQGELQELEAQQKEFVTESAERKDKDLDTMVSEDDEEL